MSEIRIQKIDGQEFVTLTDYLRLKEEKEKIEKFIEISKTEGKKVVKNGKWFVRICGDISDDPMVRLEDFQMIVREREKLKKEKQELEYLGDINEELKEENKKLKEEVKDLVERDVELNKKYMIVLTENKKLKYVIDSVMEKAGIEYIRLADGDVFTNPKNKLHISDTIQVDILNHNK